MAIIHLCGSSKAWVCYWITSKWEFELLHSCPNASSIRFISCPLVPFAIWKRAKSPLWYQMIQPGTKKGKLIELYFWKFRNTIARWFFSPPLQYQLNKKKQSISCPWSLQSDLIYLRIWNIPPKIRMINRFWNPLFLTTLNNWKVCNTLTENKQQKILPKIQITGMKKNDNQTEICNFTMKW